MIEFLTMLELFEYVQKIKSTKGLADKLVYVGKCLKIILNIYVK